MDALGVMGGIAQGANQYNENALKESQIKRDNAIKDYQIREAAKKEADDSRWIPVETFWPQYKKFPKAYETMKTAMNAQGFGEGFTEKNGIPMLRAREGKQYMAYMMMNNGIQKSTNDAMKLDAANNIMLLDEQIRTGKDAEGNTIKADQLASLQKERDQMMTAYASMNQLDHSWELQKEAIKARSKESEKKTVGFVDGVGLIFGDKNANLFTAGGEPYKGDTSKIKPIGAEVRGTPTQGTTTVITPDRTDHRTTEEKNYERSAKDPKFKDFLIWDSKRKKQDEEGLNGVRPRVTGN